MTATTTGAAAGQAGGPRTTDRGEPLIGVDDVAPPYWAQISRRVGSSTARQVTSALPRLLGLVARRCWAVSPPLTITMVALQLLAGVATAFGLLSTSDVFGSLLAGGPTPDRLRAAVPALAWVVAAVAIRAGLEQTTQLIEECLWPRVEQDAQDQLCAALAAAELTAFDDPDFNELVSRGASLGLSYLREAMSGAAQLLSRLVATTAAMVAAGLLHPVLTVVVLGAVLPQAWSSARTAQINYRSNADMMSRRRRLGVTAELLGSRSDAAEVRACSAGGVLLAEHRRTADALTGETVQRQRQIARIEVIGRTLTGVGTGAGFAVLGLLLVTGALPLALAGAAALALRTAASSVSSAVFAGNRLYAASFFVATLQGGITDARRRARPPGTATLRHIAPTVISLREVSFTYAGQDLPALSGITLTLHAGQTVALVGENGSGKSTLAKVLTGLYRPDQGSVHWDDTDTAHVDAAELFERIGIVAQDPTRWPMTAENNIRIGRIDRPDRDGAALHDAAARSGADRVIEGLPARWQSMLSAAFQTGRDLSGGQWQRISVARALYRDPPLIVADEPTAAMDAHAEHAVFDLLNQLSTTDTGDDDPSRATARPGRITVLITHRLANVRHADRIVVLHDGQITETGTHGQLMAAGGRYAQMFELQAAAYDDTAAIR